MSAVVAGVDLSVMGRRVADRARVVAEEIGSDLHLVHVLEPLKEAMIDPGIAEIMRKHQRSEAEALAEWCRGRTSIQVELEVVKGSPSWELAARAKQADLVVVGSSSIDAFNAGPITRRIARKSISDVLVVRRQPRVPYRRILVAVDFSEASRFAAERVMNLFPEADITVLYSLPSRFDPIMVDAGLFPEEVDASRGARLQAANDRMAEFVHGWEGDLRTVVVDGPPTETIDELVRRRSADLVVVGSRGATATRMVLLGTVAEGILIHAPCDVLVARSPATFRRP